MGSILGGAGRASGPFVVEGKVVEKRVILKSGENVGLGTVGSDGGRKIDTLGGGVEEIRVGRVLSTVWRCCQVGDDCSCSIGNAFLTQARISHPSQTCKDDNKTHIPFQT